MSQVYDSGETLRELRVSKTRYSGRRVVDHVLAGEHQAVPYKIRLVLYVITTALLMQSLVTLVQYREAEVLFGENGLLEWAQISMLLLSAVLLKLSSKYMSEISEGTHLLSFMPIMASVREMDQLLNDYLSDGIWEMVIIGLLVYMAYYLRLHWQDIRRQITRILAIPPAGLLFAGFLTVMVFSRMFGQQVFWQHALQEHYLRLVARIAEESCETFGYLLLVFGCIELLIFALSCKSSTSQKYQA